jgi:hypothetical protein
VLAEGEGAWLRQNLLPDPVRCLSSVRFLATRTVPMAAAVEKKV